MRARGVPLVLALLAVAGAAAGEDERRRELDDLRRAIQERRERVATYEREQRGLLETLEEIDRLAAALAADGRQARRQAREARESLVELEARTAELEERLARTRRAMAARAVALYRSGEVGPVQVLFQAGDLRDLLTRLEALRRLLRHDRGLLARAREEAEALALAREAAQLAADRHQQALARVEVRAREVGEERRAKREFMARVRADRGRERAALVELEAAARTLEETLARLPAGSRTLPGPRGAGSFVALRGRLDSPVAAPVVRGFGRVVDREFHTQIFRKGIDFAAPLGTPVRAVADGEVRFAGWFRGYGRLVILDHGERYFTVCGHLDEIRVDVGDAVAAGSVIGTVGDTGSLSGPRLYFEIRNGGQPLDPHDWLRGEPAG